MPRKGSKGEGGGWRGGSQKTTDWLQRRPVATWETEYGRLQTREGNPQKSKGGKIVSAQICRVHEDGRVEALKCACTVTIGQATDLEAVLKKYRQFYDDDTMEAAAAEREEQGRAAVEAVLAASDAMGMRDGREAREAPQKSDAPATKCTLAGGAGRLSNEALASYYGRDRVVTGGHGVPAYVFVATAGGGFEICRRPEGLRAATLLVGTANLGRDPALQARFKKLAPTVDAKQSQGKSGHNPKAAPQSLTFCRIVGSVRK